jgi:hypothetical protein
VTYNRCKDKYHLSFIISLLYGCTCNVCILHDISYSRQTEQTFVRPHFLDQTFATPCSRYICRTNCRTYLSQMFGLTLKPRFIASCSAGIRMKIRSTRGSSCSRSKSSTRRSNFHSNLVTEYTILNCQKF